jgi:hypothetical protein
VIKTTASKLEEAIQMKDRRTARRYDLSLPVIVGPPTGGDTASRTGKTRDISARGVYFTTNNALDTDGVLNLKMTLPSEATDGSEVFIRATGKVIRVDKRSGFGDQNVGVAAVFEMHEIVRSKIDNE